MPDATAAPPAQAQALRDYFAGQALVGIVLSALSNQPGGTFSHAANWQAMAARAYEAADDMLRARAGPAGGSASGTGKRPS
jgi:hypothetical protein